MEYDKKILKGFKDIDFVTSYKEENDDDHTIVTVNFGNKEAKKEDYYNPESLQARLDELNLLEQLQHYYEKSIVPLKYGAVEKVAANIVILVGALFAIAAIKKAGTNDLLPLLGVPVGAFGLNRSRYMSRYMRIKSDIIKNDYFLNYEDTLNAIIHNYAEDILFLIAIGRISGKSAEVLKTCIKENKFLTLNDIAPCKLDDLTLLNGMQESTSERIECFLQSAEKLSPLFTEQAFAGYYGNLLYQKPFIRLSDSAKECIKSHFIGETDLTFDDIDMFSAEDILALIDVANIIDKEFEKVRGYSKKPRPPKHE